MPDYHRAQREAEKLVSSFGLTRPPVDPEAIAEALGLSVVYAHFSPGISDEVSGYLDVAGNRIVVNKAIPSNRKTYTIAHELGHYVLHKEYAASNRYEVLLRKNQYENAKPPEEQEADAFAANLLVPIKLLREYKSFASGSELARLFGVSADVIMHRLKRA
jgi:Zn-dependent peptidase ImmA (M78 family)